MLQHLREKINKKTSIGLDIGHAAIKVVELSQVNGRFQLEKYALIPIKDLTKNQGAIEQVLSDLHKQFDLRSHNAVIAQPTSAVISKTIQVNAGLTEKELASHIELTVEHHIPYQTTEINYDFNILDELTVLLVATHKANIQAQLELLAAARITPKIIDVQCYAIERACALTAAQMPSKKIAVIDIGHFATSFMLFINHTLVFTHSEQFADEQQIVLLIQRIIQLSYLTVDQEPIEKIYLTGGGALLDDLPCYLATQLKIETTILNPFIGMDIASTLNSNELNKIAACFLLCCGLALRGFVS